MISTIIEWNNAIILISGICIGMVITRIISIFKDDE